MSSAANVAPINPADRRFIRFNRAHLLSVVDTRSLGPSTLGVGIMKIANIRLEMITVGLIVCIMTIAFIILRLVGSDRFEYACETVLRGLWLVGAPTLGVFRFVPKSS